MPQRPRDPSAIELGGPWNHRLLHSRGVRIHCAESGDPSQPLLLLIHGFGGGWFDWQHVLPLLAPHFHVVAIDARGYGMSDKTPRGYDVMTAASDVAGLVRALGHEEATLVAHGDGITAAAVAALTEPDRVTRVIAVNPSHPRQNLLLFLKHPYRHRNRVQLALATRFPKLGARWLQADHSSFLARICASLCSESFAHSPAFDEAIAIRRTAMGVDRVAYYACLRYRKASVATMPRTTKQAFLANWEGWIDLHPTRHRPVHVIHGGADPLVRCSMRAARAIASGTGTTEVTVIPEAGHYVHLEAPEALAEAVLLACATRSG